MGVGNRRSKDMGQKEIWHGGRRASYLLFPTPEGGGKTRLGGEVRREVQLLPRAGTRKDRDATDEDLSEGGFHMPFPLAPARPELQGTRGHGRSPRPAHADQPR
jgi:hypothetical protein